MRLFVALLCVSLVAVSSGQLSLRGRLGRSAQLKLAVQPPSVLVKNAGIVSSDLLASTAGIVPSVLVKSAGIVPAVDVAADVETPNILPQVSTLPYYPSYWPDYGASSGGWYPQAWNSPRYWNNNYLDYGTPYLPRRRLVKSVVTPVVTPVVASAPEASSSSSSTTTTTTTVNGDQAGEDAAVVPDVVADPAEY
ncbi:uncharacterized protein LOC108045953 [Drosophila rhopaloa]|uniref:Uncharacterized protein LOC108045953 n=1 Tax=Drosophila rhopaloa TaxID=1041015 RepID=A0A6P4EW27_DRORH|nr:uncharacterized protein LOC108045953 [Drosophila rhopaloa]